MVGWHHWLDGHEFEQAPRVGDRQGSLACCSPCGHKEPDTTEWLNKQIKQVVAQHFLIRAGNSSPLLDKGDSGAELTLKLKILQVTGGGESSVAWSWKGVLALPLPCVDALGLDSSSHLVFFFFFFTSCMFLSYKYILSPHPVAGGGIHGDQALLFGKAEGKEIQIR